ncbi:helicase-related protein [Myxococcus stipitatus]|uniref:helicase-related protein n=1 Tax=Myxococcus stipitatus TaxID=83455 RepID=UPI00191BE21A|nr:helicase-related protein [Myxococcus stipitatus]
MAESLLLGPLEPDETISSPPADTYLTGILWPEGETLDALEDDHDEGAPSREDGETDAGVPGYRTVRPCSLGLTFAAEADSTLMVSLAATARYALVEAEGVEEGRGARRWRRTPLDYRYEITPGVSRTWRTHDFVRSDGTSVHDPGVQLHVRRRVDGARQVVTVTLINKAKEGEASQRGVLCLFQTGLEVRAGDSMQGGAIFPRPVLPPAGADEDALSAALLYRDSVEYAVGHGVAAVWERSSGLRVGGVATSWLPASVVKGMSAKGHRLLDGFHRKHPDALKAAWLARSGERSEVTIALQAFVAVYGNWIAETLEGRVSGFDGLLQDAAETNLRRCKDARRRMADGVALLESHAHAWEAFALANAAMDRQSNHDAKGPRKGPLIWRPFQLAYMLMVLPGLVGPEYVDRDTVDLLWFPTGGGKTEAYLGLTAFQIFFRRLTDEQRRGRGGVDVLMRYTLRLLTVQQFQRAASLICACDAIRRETSKLGDAPISLGLYVGGDATPNRAADAQEALRQEHEGLKPRSTPRQLLDCPVCGRGLPPSSYTESAGRSGIDIRCGNTRCKTGGEPLPVLTVDDYIYAAPPSLLIGTIDKFAQLPRRNDLRTLFGLDGGLRPGLIIQDELHLISGPLGSMAGLYESVIDLLCTEDTLRPKVIGSTATIGQAARQVRALFDRPVLQFPPPGFDATDSFFAVQDEEGPDRLYLGVCSAGRSPKFALQAVAAALLQTTGHLKDGGSAPALLDPFWTAVLYFNSLRELGGAHVLLQDDIPRQMSFLATRLRGKRRALESDAIELSSRVPSRELPEYLAQLGIGLGGAATDPFAPVPRDVVLASNMISVGVDVSRLGLMVVNGQPKSTAEYIQASSRVGRGLHGLVVTLYNFGRPRDVSHFEHFLGYHGALYRGVEATSVTPWAPRARDKALHAVLAAAVRHLVAGMDDDEAARDFNPSDPEVRGVLSALQERARSASEGIEGDDTARDLEGIVREWAQRSQNARVGATDLLYWERKAPFGQTRPHLMTSAEEGARPGRAAWPTPNSMREVEPSTAFALRHLTRRK